MTREKIKVGQRGKWVWARVFSYGGAIKRERGEYDTWDYFQPLYPLTNKNDKKN